MKIMMRSKIEAALSHLAKKASLSDLDLANFALEEPRDPAHGQLAVNAAMTLSRAFKMKPRDLASLIVAEIKDPEGFIEKTEIAGPGFINFTLSRKWWLGVLDLILKAGKNYGRRPPTGRKVQVEFVSANPTGPLHVGHGRGAALGDALARILEFTGDQVTREYYINDAGRQMRILGSSVLARIREQEGSSAPYPADHYQGDYIKDLAQKYKNSLPADFFTRQEALIVEDLSNLAGGEILAGIKNDLADFKVVHDKWFSERTLYQENMVEKSLDSLKQAGYLYEEENALWFSSTQFGDDKNRVLRKSNGDLTYFAADIAYHQDKFNRGFDLVIDIWGADHHGYIPRMLAAVEAMGRQRDQLGVVLVQLVNLLRGGQLVSMSTRAGEFVTLKEVVDEVGADAARFIFLTRSHESTLDFDLDLAKAKTRDNPVYYVQYLCARISRMLDSAGNLPGPLNAERLTEPEELDLLKHLAGFPETLMAISTRLEPHHLTSWLSGLAKLFHHYYSIHRLICENDPELTTARLTLARAIREVTAIGLDLLGVTAPEKM